MGADQHVMYLMHCAFSLHTFLDAKTLYTTYQVISGTELTLGVIYPSPFAEATKVMKMTELSFITIIPFDCLYPNYSYYNTYMFYVLSPLVVIAMLLIDFLAEKFYSERRIHDQYHKDCEKKKTRLTGTLIL